MPLTFQIQVATRPNPQYNIGAVDSSCALVLCDLAKPDAPIVYCSEPFEQLTGYRSSEVIGRNCRFLQSPTGAIMQGERRSQYGVDDQKIWRLKNTIATRREGQFALVNYKKGGTPFLNVLTTIPIRFGNENRIRYVVGFQADGQSIFPC